ncbi:heavy metal translocating P-type ATPase [Gilvibacter sp.]|uniref:heavy metal translocating P-type ATPase n=1 Tax=Gilvibacter sp. TaxID=2729997 RepID=UPI0035BE3087
MEACYHCGDPCGRSPIIHQQKSFCCNGCKTVYDILHQNGMEYYYELEKAPGTSQNKATTHFDYLDNPEIAASLLQFSEADRQLISFEIPAIHCSSCIWVLENLGRLHPGVYSSTVNFPAKKAQIQFNEKQLSVKALVVLLSRIGYQPKINLASAEKDQHKEDRSLIYKLGIAGFAFGNIMFLSFPEYFDFDEIWLEHYKPMFRTIMLLFSLPVVFYAASDYFKAAFKGLRSGMLNIDLPIALGVSVLFLRSVVDVIMDWGPGFFDSLSGLVFFLLLGRFFQQKTYSYLSFERDYKSYFPLGVTRLSKHKGKLKETQIPLKDIQKGDHLLIRSNEIIPADGTLQQGEALIDYSFVTGEALPIHKSAGATLYAGGKQCGAAIEIEVTKTVSQSYLTQLWGNAAFDKGKSLRFNSLTDQISKRFTITIVSIAVLSGLIWWFLDPSMMFNVITAVLIVACPCAIALSAPFTLGNLVRLFGRNNCYVKNSATIENWSSIDTVVFDKTGTLSTPAQSAFSYHGLPLSVEEQRLLYSSLRASNHPLSRSLYNTLEEQEIVSLDDFSETLGQGIRASKNEQSMKIGASSFVHNQASATAQGAVVHISSGAQYKGHYVFQSEYRQGLKELLQRLATNKKLAVLTGDNDSQASHLNALIPAGTEVRYQQSPQDKLDYIKSLQDQGHKVMMIGDGLNDSGAMAQSDIGIAIAEDTNVFTPASDAILQADSFEKLAAFFGLAKLGKQIIYSCFAISLLYNLIGLGFAVTGHLEPVVAAILMPLSSISIVIFTTISTRYFGMRLLKSNRKNRN